MFSAFFLFYLAQKNVKVSEFTHKVERMFLSDLKIVVTILALVNMLIVHINIKQLANFKKIAAAILNSSFQVNAY